MTLSDDTTTLENPDNEEDQTLVLTGAQRLEYFANIPKPSLQPLESRKKSLFQTIKNLFC